MSDPRDPEKLEVVCTLPPVEGVIKQWQRGMISLGEIEEICRMYKYVQRASGDQLMSIRAEKLKLRAFINEQLEARVSMQSPRSLDFLLCDAPGLRHALEGWLLEVRQGKQPDLVSLHHVLSIENGVISALPYRVALEPAAARTAFVDYILGSAVPCEHVVRVLADAGAHVIAISNSDRWNERLLAAGAQEAIPAAELLQMEVLPAPPDIIAT